MRDSLKKLPLELSTIYNNALVRVRDETPEPEESGLRIVEIVLCSARRLFLDELQHALATKKDDDAFHEDGCYRHSEILARTGGLLTIEEDQSVQFMHHTVDEYLKQPQVYDENFSHGHLRLAQKCRAYLSFTIFKRPSEDIERLHREYHFLRYAAYRLGYHMSKCIAVGLIGFDEATEFLEKNVPLASLQVVASKILTIPSANRMDKFLEESSILTLAILWDIKPLVEHLIREGANVEVKSFKDATPLHIAARTASVSSTRFLLEAKADVSATDIEGRTALDLIMSRPWVDMIIRINDLQLLTFLIGEMEKYIQEAESKNISEMSAEAYAAEMILSQKPRETFNVTESDIMKELEKLRPSQKEYAYVSALIIHLFKLDITDDSEKVAIMLLDARVDVNSIYVHETSPLQLAALYGREKMVQKLLDCDANPFLKGLLGFNALQIAEIRAAKMPDKAVFKSIASLIAVKMDGITNLEEQLTNERERLSTAISCECVHKLSQTEIPGPSQAKSIEIQKARAFDYMVRRIGMKSSRTREEDIERDFPVPGAFIQ